VSPPEDGGGPDTPAEPNPETTRTTGHRQDSQQDNDSAVGGPGGGGDGLAERRADFTAFIDACCGGQTGKLFTPIGRDPHWVSRRRPDGTLVDQYDHRAFLDKVILDYPDDLYTDDDRRAPDKIDKLFAESEHHDVWACPNLMYKTRTKGSLVGCMVIHADWDGNPDDTDAVLQTVKTLSGFAVASGTPGHIHAYVALSEPVNSAEATWLCKAFQAQLPPGSDPGKHTVENLLRPPGTYSHKSVATTGRPTPVGFLIRPDGGRFERWSPKMLAFAFSLSGHAKGVELPQWTAEANGQPNTASTPTRCAPVDLSFHPDVQAALDKDTGDRSEDIYRVVGACLDASFTYEQTQQVVLSRADLAEKLGEVGGDDLTRCWDKLIAKQQQLVQEKNIVTPSSPPSSSDETPSALDRLAVNGADLDAEVFAELNFAVDGILCEGVGLCVGPPKIGKSWLVGDFGLGVAAGDVALGTISVDERPVLYLALEDGKRRLQKRSRLILAGQPIPEQIDFITDASPNEAMLAAEEFMQRHRDEKPVVIIDTLGKIKRQKRPGEESYLVDYEIGTKLKKLAAIAPGSTVLVVHHTRKAEAEDFIDSVSGTHGLAGSVDFVLVLKRKRLSNDAILSVTGRDIPEAEYALHAEDGMLWRLDGDDLSTASDTVEKRRAAEKVGDRMMDVYLEVRAAKGTPVSAVEIAGALGDMDNDTAGQYLRRLAASGYISKAKRGLYVVSEVSEPPEPPATPRSAEEPDSDTATAAVSEVSESPQPGSSAL
jgi:hypothetical protein